MKRRVQEMEREAAKLKEMQAQVVQEMSSEMSEGKMYDYTIIVW
jgi:hypothetical protein